MAQAMAGQENSLNNRNYSAMPRRILILLGSANVKSELDNNIGRLPGVDRHGARRACVTRRACCYGVSAWSEGCDCEVALGPRDS